MKVFDSIKRLLKGVAQVSAQTTAVNSKLEDLKILTAKIIIERIKAHGIYNNLHETEFKVYSQAGDDGIIQYLINTIDIESRTFIEFGVENYTEANTRFLLVNNNWKGLVIDGSRANVDYIRNDKIYWQYDLTAVNSFINRDNIDEIIAGNNFSGELGILSIDIDGNDYWIWKSIEGVNPAIVIVEYNSVFGSKYALTVPYDSAFQRTAAHTSNLFWGCSLKALCMLAEAKNYAFVGSNSYGNNAYFVRKDKLGEIKAMDAETGYVKSKFRESRDAEGRLSYISGDARIEEIKDMIVYDVENDTLVKLKELK